MKRTALTISSLKRSWKGRAYRELLRGMAVVLNIAILLASSSACADGAADKKLKFFRGTTPQTSAIEFGWPTWEMIREEEPYYPLQRVETVSGTLIVHGYNFYGSQHLLLDDRELADAIVVQPLMAYPERQGKPAIIISKLLREEDFAKHYRDTAVIRIIDMGASPPFISKDYLHISFHSQEILSKEKCFQSHDCRPTPYADAIKKLDTDTYMIFGVSTDEKDSAGNPLPVSYSYSRKNRTVTRIK